MCVLLLEVQYVSDKDRIQMLELALIEYVRKYGFIEKARSYFISVGELVKDGSHETQ